MPDRPVVSKRSGGGRGRARKRRPQAGGSPPPAPTQGAARERASRRAAHGDPRERPQAPWHPLPLSELLILVGAVAAIIAFTRKPLDPALLVAGLAAVAIGTLEVTVREHLGGYRSHTLLLALIPPIAFHSAVIFGLAYFIRVPRWLSLPLLLPDVALFALLFNYLRRRYLDASRARAFALGR